MSSSSSSSPYSSGRSSPVHPHVHSSSRIADDDRRPSLATLQNKSSFTHSPASSPYSTSPELGSNHKSSPLTSSLTNMSTTTQAAPAPIPASRRGEEPIPTSASGGSYGAYLNHHVPSSSPPGSASTSPSFTYFTQYQASSSAGANFRRGSTPASSFLPARFLGAPNNAHADAFAASSLLPPRRTSFGTGLGGAPGRLGALSALGLAPPPMSPPSHNAGLAPSSERSGPPGGVRHSPSTPALPTVTSSASSQPSSPKVPQKPPQQPKKHVWVLPGPDGLCVETKGRRRRASEAA